MLKGITDDERKLLDDFEDVEYDRKAVEVVLTVTLLFGSEQPILYIYIGVWADSVINLLMLFRLQDTSEKLQVGTYVWKNKDDPDLYGEWDFEV